MLANALGTNLNAAASKAGRSAAASAEARAFQPPISPPALCPKFTLLDHEDFFRIVAVLHPKPRQKVEQQLASLLAQLTTLLQAHPGARVIQQSAFLRSIEHQSACERAFQQFYGQDPPITNFVWQPPANGSVVALEVWLVGGPEVKFESFGARTKAVTCGKVRWIYCTDAHPEAPSAIYTATESGFSRLHSELRRAGSGFEDVVRTWLYLGGITEADGATQRYMELNRARADYYQTIPFGRQWAKLFLTSPYPASTGIGMNGRGVVLTCLALQSDREDILIRPLENPQQTPAYDYNQGYSPKSPKFSRAMALRVGNSLTTWVSGTASIVKSESCHFGDIARQTHQTIDNIAHLISSRNLAAHGLGKAQSGLESMAKLRVYIKKHEDYAACRSICEKRLPAVPILYSIADVCRPELLVEIEGVAFAKL
jgi:enamine deaminase RidA (YjgF/YER057c/UK114 family)